MKFLSKQVSPREPDPRAPVKDAHVAWLTNKTIEGAEHSVLFLQNICSMPEGYVDLRYNYRLHPLPGQDQAEFDELCGLAIGFSERALSANGLILVRPELSDGTLLPRLTDDRRQFNVIDAAHLLSEISNSLGAAEHFAQQTRVRYPGLSAAQYATLNKKLDAAIADCQARHPAPVHEPKLPSWIAANRDYVPCEV